MAIEVQPLAGSFAREVIGLQLWEFTALLLDSFAIAAQSLVGAALGGSDAHAARAMAWYSATAADLVTGQTSSR